MSIAIQNFNPVCPRPHNTHKTALQRMVLSIKKIAKEAGVSTATVSRVLNNPGYKCSSEELRERIWKIARELNYMPNEAARNLKKGITNTSQKVWYFDVLMTRTGNLETDPFFSELLRVIESEIHRQGCILMHIFHQPLFSNDRKCRTENIDKVIAQMEPDGEIRSDGLIIIGKCNDNVLKKLSAKYKSIFLSTEIQPIIWWMRSSAMESGSQRWRWNI